MAFELANGIYSVQAVCLDCASTGVTTEFFGDLEVNSDAAWLNELTDQMRTHHGDNKGSPKQPQHDRFNIFSEGNPFASIRSVGTEVVMFGLNPFIEEDEEGSDLGPRSRL